MDLPYQIGLVQLPFNALSGLCRQIHKGRSLRPLNTLKKLLALLVPIRVHVPAFRGPLGLRSLVNTEDGIYRPFEHPSDADRDNGRYRRRNHNGCDHGVITMLAIMVSPSHSERLSRTLPNSPPGLPPART